MKKNNSKQPKNLINALSEEEINILDNSSFSRTDNSNKIWKKIFLILSALSLILLILLSQSAGISGDEFYHYEQAENVYKYYSSFGNDSTAAVVTEKYNLPYYGQSVDN